MAHESEGDLALVRALLRAQFVIDVADVVPLVGGEFSRAFACTIGEGGYVVRLSAFGHATEAFAKDDYAKCPLPSDKI